MNYKGYIAQIEYDENAETFFGTVINSSALVSFRGTNVKELTESFKDAIDTYLKACDEENIKAYKPYSGKFNLRIPPDLHQKIAIKAALNHESMNEHIEKLLLNDTKGI